MLEALLVYLGETQREGRVVTRRLRVTIILSVLTGIFFLIAFIAAVVAGSIYLARHVGAGPAALVVAGTAFLLGVIMLVALAIVKRPSLCRTTCCRTFDGSAACRSTAGPAIAADTGDPGASLCNARRGCRGRFSGHQGQYEKVQVISWRHGKANRASRRWMRGFFYVTREG